MTTPDHIYTDTRSRRRALLVSGLAAVLAGPAACLARPSRPASSGKLSDGKADEESSTVVPDGHVSLAAFGGVPSAGPVALKQAFAQAFDALKERGGGTLLVPPGAYDFGSYGESEMIVRADNLRNIVIAANGATFRATTTGKAMPSLFYLVNPNNVTITGAHFTDPGFDPTVNWKGMYCVGLQADRMSRRLRIIDCTADSVVGLFSANNNSATRHLIEDVSIRGEVRNAYYGVSASYIREQVKVDLRCHDVRRAFIAYALKNADIIVNASSTARCLGSNGLIALVSIGGQRDNVENVRIRVNATGAGVYGSYVHFYHQGPVPDGYMRDIDATVNLVNVSSPHSVYMFDHETHGVQRTTARSWDKIYLRGSVVGKFDGRLISNPSVSTAASRVYAERKLAASADMSKLPAYFHVGTP